MPGRDRPARVLYLVAAIALGGRFILLALRLLRNALAGGRAGHVPVLAALPGAAVRGDGRGPRRRRRPLGRSERQRDVRRAARRDPRRRLPGAGGARRGAARPASRSPSRPSRGLLAVVALQQRDAVVGGADQQHAVADRAPGGGCGRAELRRLDAPGRCPRRARQARRAARASGGVERADHEHDEEQPEQHAPEVADAARRARSWWSAPPPVVSVGQSLSVDGQRGRREQQQARAASAARSRRARITRPSSAAARPATRPRSTRMPKFSSITTTSPRAMCWPFTSTSTGSPAWRVRWRIEPWPSSSSSRIVRGAWPSSTVICERHVEQQVDVGVLVDRGAHGAAARRTRRPRSAARARRERGECRRRHGGAGLGGDQRLDLVGRQRRVAGRGLGHGSGDVVGDELGVLGLGRAAAASACCGDQRLDRVVGTSSSAIRWSAAAGSRSSGSTPRARPFAGLLVDRLDDLLLRLLAALRGRRAPLAEWRVDTSITRSRICGLLLELRARGRCPRRRPRSASGVDQEGDRDLANARPPGSARLTTKASPIDTTGPWSASLRRFFLAVASSLHRLGLRLHRRLDRTTTGRRTSCRRRTRPRRARVRARREESS